MGRVQPPCKPYIYIQTSEYEGLGHGSNFQVLKKRLKSRMKLIFRSLFFINGFHIKITLSDKFFPVKFSVFYFLTGYYKP